LDFVGFFFIYEELLLYFVSYHKLSDVGFDVSSAIGSM